ncbi:Hypothetical protein HDN1F_11360 [gamma proteobacterium HdN1]|nr:Hypothetical protein HDN1F_11360 [gamma proteobacterium HdN1]
MFDKLKQWFTEELFTSGERRPTSIKSLNHGKMVAEWLKRYQEQHQLIQFVTREAEEGIEQYPIHAGIFQIDPSTKTFSLEELHPASASKLLTPGMPLFFTAIVDGIRHKFTAHYLRTDELLNGTAHWCNFPTTIEQLQLRNAYRVTLPESVILTISLTHATKPFFSGLATDISATGARILVEGQIYPEPIQGDTYSVCRLLMPHGQEIFCQAQLMHFHYLPSRKATSLGIMFLGMESMHERSLSKFLTDLQRREKELQSDKDR